MCYLEIVSYPLLSTLTMMSVIAGCAGPRIFVQDFSAEQIIHYSQMKNIENVSDYVVYLNEGDRIPLKMTLDSELLDIASEDIHLVLKQKVYFRLRMPEGIDAENESAMTEEERQKFFGDFMIYLSPDAKTWAPYTDVKAVEQVFGIEGGSFSFGMGITKEDGIIAFLNARTTP